MSSESPDRPAAHVSARPPVGCLLLHGLTSGLSAIDGLAPYLRARDIPYALPVLRGHGTEPGDLRGVTWHDWYDDASDALDALLTRCDAAIPVGLSMGALVALHLGVQRPQRLAGVVSVAAALELLVPYRPLWPILGRLPLLADVDIRNAFEDATLVATARNYPAAPLSSIGSLRQFGQLVERELPKLRLPLLTIYTPRDRVVSPAGARLVHERAGTPAEQKRLLIFEESGHELFLDRQRDAVCEAVIAFVEEQASRLTSGTRGAQGER